MQTHSIEPRQPAGRNGMMHNRWVKIAGIVIAVVVLILVIVPFFVNADTFRPAIEGELSAALGRKVTLGHLSFSLWSGSLVADNVAVADDPKFGTAPFFQAQSLRIGVETGAFLFHHAVKITKFVAKSPEIRLVSDQNGQWNYASLANGTGTGTNQGSGSAPQVTVGEVEIENGRVEVSSVPAVGQPFMYSDVNITIRNLSETQAMPFTVSANLPGDGSVNLDGTAGPIAKPDTEYTPLHATLAVKHFDPVKAGVLPASEGIGMVADINAQVTSDGKTLSGTGGVNAAHLLLSRGGSPAPQPVDMEFTANTDLRTRTGQLQDMAIRTGSATVHLNGSWKMAGQTPQLNLHLAAPGVPVDQLEAFLPAVGIRLPSGSRLQGGTLTATLGITGTAQAPVISGPVEVDNTRLAGFALGSKIQGLKALGGTGNATDIRTLRAEVTSTVPSTQLNNIYADVPAIGTATGNGTVSAAGALNFSLTAKLSSTGQVGGLVNGAANALGGIAGGLLHSTMTNGVPLTITGTTSNPVIRADLGAMLKGKSGAKKNTPGSLLNGLLGR